MDTKVRVIRDAKAPDALIVWEIEIMEEGPPIVGFTVSNSLTPDPNNSYSKNISFDRVPDDVLEEATEMLETSMERLGQ